MRQLFTGELQRQKLAELGLANSPHGLSSPEAIACALRRVASFLCPCPAASLVRNVVQPLRGLNADLEFVKNSVEETIDAMAAHGDLLEHRDVEVDDKSGVPLVYAAPPSFVARESGAVILLGIAADERSALPAELENRICFQSHVRTLHPVAGEKLPEVLVDLGLIQIPYKDWLKSPAHETASEHVNRLDSLLTQATPSRDVPGLSLLDGSRPVRYYRGRWTEPKKQSGRFVARRSQAYGADLWSYVELNDGNPVRLIDFPISMGRWRGCDEAWYLQMALDSAIGKPQQFQVLADGEGCGLLKLFSPVPMWVRRRWDAVGVSVQTSGCLFSYRLHEAEIEEERAFAKAALWLDEVQ